MSVPYYAEKEQICEYCEGEIYLGDEAVLYDNCLFHDDECLTGHIKELTGATSVYLTDDELHRSVD